MHRFLGDRYAVEREVGAGGMATVYVAEDRKHGRRVAIKVLRPELAVTLGAERFLREIEIAARLQHPHILPLYDSGSADGLLFYVMPFVEGESLAVRLAREGPLPLRDACRIAAEVAGALDYAHRQGFIHRDIKPGNILLSEGHAVVADFGIARALSAAAGTGSTLGGVAVGTPAYMSPEQASAETDEIDGRTDIYALGCVLFEMLTGKPPFQGADYKAILAQVLTTKVPSVSESRPEVPPVLEQAIVQALAKEPEERYATASEFREALERPITGDVAALPRWRRYSLQAVVVVLLVALAAVWWLRPLPLASSVATDAQVIAVLPFTTSGPEVDLLGEGMVDLLSTNLNGVGGVRTVDPRTVLGRWRRRAENGIVDHDGALAIGRDVNAGSVLTGSVVSAGADVRLTAELYAVTGEQLARVSLDGSADNVLALVDSLSLEVMREIWRSQEPIPDFRVSGITTGSLDAVREYLEGMQHYRRSEWDSAITHFGTAVEHDSTFALALFGLSSSYGWSAGIGSSEWQDYAAAAARHSERLPTRVRSLLVGNQLHAQGRFAALDTMRAYVTRFPNDPEGWFLLADVQYHAQGLIGLPFDELLAPFDQVFAMDSSLSPAVIHPLELSLLYTDSARFHRYLNMLEPEVAAREQYGAVGRLLWRGEPAGAEDVARVIEYQPAASFVVYQLPRVTDRIAADTVLAAFEVIQSRAPDYAGRMVQARLGTLLRGGRFRDTRVLLDSLWSVDPIKAAYLELNLAMAAYPHWSGGERALETLEEQGLDPSKTAFPRAFYALSRGDAAAALEALAQVDTTSADPALRELLNASRAWTRLLEGDTAQALDEMRGALMAAGYSPVALQYSGPIRYGFATALASRPATRDEGIRRLENDWFAWGFSPFLDLTLGEFKEAAGDLEGAGLSYATFIRLWKHADSELQQLVQYARLRLELLTGES